ncbi:hypothetical protein SAMN04487950_1970 [Halogranum rubrum]|uniref:Uncharacterized protein n=1 Tax=Halogranum rubrum TaxID=553466 RepID=A0A1I4E7N5_9EURY|nr:hypothetical protein [Halogranum rubrum]SFL01782.1 hypothetical protein SAMN04487950_1970 [Halogranum rubrum]
MVLSLLNDGRDVDVSDLVAVVGVALCLTFGGAALLDQALNTDLWPPGAEYGTGFLGYLSLYWLFARQLSSRRRLVSNLLLTFSVTAMVVAAYTNPEGVLTPLALVTLLATFAYGGGHALRSLGTSGAARDRRRTERQ